MRKTLPLSLLFLSVLTLAVNIASATVINTDINGDGITDIRDIAIVAKAFGSYPGHPRWNPDADLDGDLRITIHDVYLVIQNYGY